MPSSPSRLARTFRTTLRARLATLLAAVCLTAPGCGKHPAPPEASASPAGQNEVLQAELVTVAETSWPTIVRAQGSLVADEVSVLGAKVAGRVAEVRFDLGDRVAANQPLVALDEREFELQVAQARAQWLEARAAIGLSPEASEEDLDPRASPPVREAKAVLDEALLRRERIQRLFDEQAASEEAFQQAEAAVKVAESRHASALNGANERIAQIRVRSAELDVAQQRLVDARTLAPFSGLVQQRHVAPGTFVQIGQPLFTLVRTDKLRFRGTMPERHAQQLALGQAVTLAIEGVAEPRQVEVTRISPAIDELSRSLLFEALVDNPNDALRAGLFAQAEVVLNADARALVLPDSAVLEFAGVEKVWKVVDGEAREQVVQTGQRRGDEVEIVTGLEPDERVLVYANQGRSGPVREAVRGASAKVEAARGPAVTPGTATPADAGASTTSGG